MTLERIFIHPLKSGGGLEVSSWPLDALGLVHDRRLMLVDEAGTFVTLRGTPKLVTLRPRALTPTDHALVLEAPGLPPLSVPLEPSPDTLEVQVWSDWVRASHLSAEADAWSSEALGKRVRLVLVDPTFHRQVDLRFAPPDTAVGFADGFPLLLVGSASLEALSERLGHPVEAQRFRPNLVVKTSTPHEEDAWRKIRIGHVEIDLVKPCARCVGINVDPHSGHTSREPLRTLSTYRKRERDVFFGYNALHRNLGTLTIGDPVQVLAT